MRCRGAASLAGALALTVALAAPAAAQPTIEVVAEGLAGPRGVAIAPDGAVWVAETGSAGDTCIGEGEDAACFGLTGAITRIADGMTERVIEGLPSSGSGPEVGGVSDLAFIDDDSFYMVVNLGDDPATREGEPAGFELEGWLLRGSTDGTFEPVADIAAFEASDNPDAGEFDSNPHAVAAVDGGAVVADAGGNSLVLADESGSVSLIAAFPPLMAEFTPEQMAALAALGPPPGEGDVPEGGAPEAEAPPDDMPESDGAPGPIRIPVQSVPTSVVVGPDGAYYVGQLTGGPFPVGGASVLRVVPGEEPQVYAGGFTNIIDLGFGPDGTLYVAEIVHDGLMSVFAEGAPPVGAVLSVPPGGGEPELLVTGEQMMAPGGLAVADDGSVYVTTGTIIPGGGALVKITP